MTNKSKFIISLLAAAFGWGLTGFFSYERYETTFAFGCAVGILASMATVFYLGHTVNDYLNSKHRGYY